MWPNPQIPADLVTFTEEIHNGKLHFLCSVNGVFKVSNQTYWKLGVDILINQFSSWNWKKTLELQTFQQLYSTTSAYLGKMCVHVLELFFWKCNKNAVFLFKKTYNKEKVPQCFLLCLVVAHCTKNEVLH